jgi:hypothetical protein
LRDKSRLRVLENRVLKIICGRKWDNETGEWIRLFDREIYDVSFLPDIIAWEMRLV